MPRPKRGPVPAPAKPSHGGARVGAGRKPRPEGSRDAIIVLSPTAAAILDTVPAGERSAWVSALIEESTRAVAGRPSSKVVR